jgi:hypothetical protein
MRLANNTHYNALREEEEEEEKKKQQLFFVNIKE